MEVMWVSFLSFSFSFLFFPFVFLKESPKVV